MSKVKTYAVNCNDAWLNTDGDDISESYVKYADYMVLATKLELAERACAELVAENARLKSAVTRQIELRAEIKKAGRPPHADFLVQSICEAEEKVNRALEETPATDAFLAEVRAQGVDMARNAMIDFVDGEVGPNNNVPGLIRGAEICVSIAEQIRKGVEQK